MKKSYDSHTCHTCMAYTARAISEKKALHINKTENRYIANAVLCGCLFSFFFLLQLILSSVFNIKIFVRFFCSSFFSFIIQLAAGVVLYYVYICVSLSYLSVLSIHLHQSVYLCTVYMMYG